MTSCRVCVDHGKYKSCMDSHYLFHLTVTPIVLLQTFSLNRATSTQASRKICPHNNICINVSTRLLTSSKLFTKTETLIPISTMVSWPPTESHDAPVKAGKEHGSTCWTTRPALLSPCSFADQYSSCKDHLIQTRVCPSQAKSSTHCTLE